MQYRCINDPVWTYCHNEERWQKQYAQIMIDHPDTKVISSVYFKCELDRSICGLNYSSMDKLDPRLGKGGVKETLIPIQTIVNQGKQEVKKVDKKKADTQQGSLF